MGGLEDVPPPARRRAVGRKEETLGSREVFRGFERKK